MILCVCMPSCLSVFVSKGDKCKGYHFTHRYLTGLQFWYFEEEKYFYKSMFYSYVYTYNTWLHGAEHTCTNMFVRRENMFWYYRTKKKCDICCIVFLNQNRCINILVSLTNDLINRCSYLTNKCTFYFQKVNQCFSAQ